MGEPKKEASTWDKLKSRMVEEMKRLKESQSAYANVQGASKTVEVNKKYGK